MNKRIYVFCNSHLDSFILPIIDYLRQFYDVHMFYGGSHQEFWDTINKGDLIWFEWAVEWLRDATAGEKSTLKYLVRMHSFEIFTPVIAQINWNQVDGLIVPNRSLFDVIDTIKSYDMEEQRMDAERKGQKISLRLDMFPPNFIKDRIYTIPNPVDGKKFYRKDKGDNKKIAVVGHVNHKKDPMLPFYILMEILKYDPKFTLHIAGGFQEIRYRVKMDELIKNAGLQDKVFFYNVPDEALPQFLEDKNYVLSTSLFESFHYSIANGMSAGLIPLIGGWPGCKYLYPEKYVFYSISDCIDIIKRSQQGNLIEEGKKCRQWIMDRYRVDKVLPQFKRVVDRLLWEDTVAKKFGSKNLFSEIGVQHLDIKDIVSHCKRMGRIKR